MMVKRIAWFSLKKLFKLVTLLVAVSALSYMLVNASPINPVRAYIGADYMTVSPEQRENIAEYWGLHESGFQQFLSWGNAVLHGNLGTSMIFRDDVASVIAERFMASLLLLAIAWVLSGIFGFLLGIIAGMNKHTWLDKLVKGYCFTLASTPTFWLGIVLLILFGVWLGWFPIGLATPAGMVSEQVTWWARLQHIILPALTLSIIGVANVALHTREKLIEVLNSEFVRYARAKGEKGLSLLVRHGLRNISLPAISLHFATFGELFGGLILAEQVFSYPGLGQTVVQAGLSGDVPLLLGITLFSALFIFMGNLIADILYEMVDPRMAKGASTDG